MFNQTLHAVIMILVAVGVLFFAWLASFTASLFNIKLVSELHFDRDRFYAGIFRLMTIIIVSVMLAIIFTMLPIICNYYGATIPDKFVDTYNVVVIFLAFINATIKYVKQAYDKLTKVINNGFIDEEATTSDTVATDSGSIDISDTSNSL